MQQVSDTGVFRHGGGACSVEKTRKANKHAKKEDSPVSYEACSDLEKDASSIRRLRHVDACIVVEEIGESSFREAAEVVEMILASGKPILGTVYL